MNKFQNKYRIPSARMPGWDYSGNGVYFITICAAGRKHFFGKIENNEMQVSEIGKIAHDFLQDIPTHFPYSEIDAMVIMPNHVHMILIMNRTAEKLQSETLQCNVFKRMSEISPKAGSVSTIIRSYKAAVTKAAKSVNRGFGWQSRFHDYIIRNDASYNKINQYIIDNPMLWEQDKFYG